MLAYELEGDIEPNAPLVNLRPDIGTGDCNVEFALTMEECALQSPFCFPDPTMWNDNPTAPNCSWPGVPLLGDSFEGGCPPYTFFFNPQGPIPGPGAATLTDAFGDTFVFECIDIPFSGTVEWMVTDACGQSVSWSFTIDVLCINCPPGATCSSTGNITLPPCGVCEDADVNADPTTPCHSCDATILDGFCSCTPPGSTGIDPNQFNANALCDDGFVANNISWFSFTAGASSLSVDVTDVCLLYTSPSPRDGLLSRMPSSA